MDAKSGANIKTAKLTLGDQSWSFPVYEGTIGPEVIDVSKLYAETGRFTYDPGFTSTGACESKITYIDGDEGVLLYRGYPIDDLAEQTNLLARMQSLHAGGDHDVAGREPTGNRDSRRVVTQHLDVAERDGLARWIDDPNGGMVVVARECAGGDRNPRCRLELHAPADGRAEQHRGGRIDQTHADPKRWHQ